MKIAILGHGVVGSGVAEVILTNNGLISKKMSEKMEIKHILDLREFPELPYSDLFTKDFADIRDDDEVAVVAEVMGGIEPAFTFTKECLSRGKSVVTSNKELVARYGAELLQLASANNCNYFFEASVGGGIPIIKPMHRCLDANEITEIAGILNGTTNFILTKMYAEGMKFKDALALAQELGYAERNPAADIDGHDACRKICILSSLAFGTHIYPDSIYCEGITNITPQDVAYATQWGGVIKLVGRAKKMPNGKFAINLSPALLPKSSPLARVDDVFNAVMVRGNAVGEVMFYGPGAGKLPTASAVVSDIIEATRHCRATLCTLAWQDGDGSTVEAHDNCPVKAFLRLEDKPETSAMAYALFGEVHPLESIGDDVAIITGELTEHALTEKINALKENDIAVLSVVRILED